MKRQIFYSFHYDNDVFRVQQLRNMGAFEENQPVSHNEWETVKKGGDKAIKEWIDESLKYKSCTVVLIGEETARRPWVKHEFKKSWESNKGLLGIYIHNLRDPRTGVGRMGTNPFDEFSLPDGSKLSSRIKCYTPNPLDAYNDIRSNLSKWIETAVQSKQ